MELMGRESARDPVPDPVERGALALFEAGKHEGPSASAPNDEGEVDGKFRLDLLGTYTSPWNKAAAVAFAKSFRSYNDHKHFKATEKDITKRFIKHIRTIQTHFKNQLEAKRNGSILRRPTLKDILAAARNRVRTVRSSINRNYGSTETISFYLFS